MRVRLVPWLALKVKARPLGLALEEEAVDIITIIIMPMGSSTVVSWDNSTHPLENRVPQLEVFLARDLHDQLLASRQILVVVQRGMLQQLQLVLEEGVSAPCRA